MTRTLLEQYLGKCRHFNGLMQDTCAAGIRYVDVKGPDSAHGWGDIPCLKARGGEAMTTCPLQSWLTVEEAQAKVDRARRVAQAFFADLAEDRCPHCKTPIESWDQVGRCVYADPCGHRLYQGTAPDDKPRTMRKVENWESDALFGGEE